MGTIKHPPVLDGLPVRPSYTVFVPTDLVGRSTQPRLDPRVQHVGLVYGDADTPTGLYVLNGPAGCCLDADPRKSGVTLSLANGTLAHYLNIEDSFGGPILWWVQDGTYVAVSGPGLTKEVAERIANSTVPALVAPVDKSALPQTPMDARSTLEEWMAARLARRDAAVLGGLTDELRARIDVGAARLLQPAIHASG